MKPLLGRKLGTADAVVLLLIILATALKLFIFSPVQPSTPAASTSTVASSKIKPVETAEECAAGQPLSFLVGQALMIGVHAKDMAGEAALFKTYHVGGAVLTDSPANPYDGSIKKFKVAGGSAGDQLLISTDEEGGDVQRFVSLGVLPAPAQVPASYTPAQIEKLIAQHGAAMKTVGIDMVLGPLADVAPKDGTSPLGDRVFSNSPSVVSAYALAYLNGWQAAGLLPTLKHFPGLGSASGNTDFGPATTPSLSMLKTRDFVPYQNLAATNTAVMIGNQTVPSWFSGPASLSPKVNKYLRQTLGYKNNLILTDSLTAVAVTDFVSVPKAVVLALEAGNDMPLIVDASTNYAANKTFITQAVAAIEKAVESGQLSKQQLAASVARKLAAQNINACSLANAGA